MPPWLSSFPMEHKRFLAAAGRKGGRRRSAAKRAAAVLNGRKGALIRWKKWKELKREFGITRPVPRVDAGPAT